ncbi:MAG: methylated-DNA--[protein]-cysteine S-methyltransferase [Rhodospirillales bacterium]|nr:methylated-DNA--[protein]-cysteine S-methyltransferase [Rhodospirillales bacterium]
MPLISFHSPIGPLSIAEEEGAIVALDWGWGSVQSPTALLRRAREQLEAYFDGAAAPFDLPLAPQGSAYQRRVWAALCTVPRGAVWTYGQLARAAGGSPRSIGGAMGRNPIPIIIPCHRVVAQGGPGGYSGAGGLATKHYLLGLEGAALPRAA